MRRAQSFYKYHIENRRRRYRLMIGTAGDHKGEYSYIENTYFGILCPEAGATHFTAESAQAALNKLKEFIARHPIYSRATIFS